MNQVCGEHKDCISKIQELEIFKGQQIEINKNLQEDINDNKKLLDSIQAIVIEQVEMRKDVDSIKIGLDEFKTDTTKKLDSLGTDIKGMIERPQRESSEIKVGIIVGIVTGIVCLIAGYFINVLI